MNRRKLSAGLIAGAMALTGLAVGVGVADAAPVASEFTLPLPVPLTVKVSTGPGGAITDVSVNPASATLTVTKAQPNKVSFTSAGNEGIKVSVRSKGQTQSVSAKAASFDAFIGGTAAGAGTWTGEVFPGVTGVVPYEIGGSAAAPTITVGAITGGGVAAPAETSTHDDGDEVSTKVVVTFTSAPATGDKQTRTLTIRVKVENESDDDDDDSPESHASLSISLGKLRGLPGAAPGTKTWSGLLCDGTTATVTYDVDATGKINVTGSSVVGFEVKNNDGRTQVRFPTGERIKIKAKVDSAGLTINVDEKIRCKDAADPTVNGVLADVVSDDSDHHDDHHDGDHKDGDHNSDDGNGGHRGGDDDKKSDD